MGVLKSDNERVRLSKAHKWGDINLLYETDMTESIIIVNRTQHDEKTYTSINSVPIKKISLFSSFLKELRGSKVNRVQRDRLLAFKKSEDTIQNRECPVCKKSNSKGWVVTFSSNPAFFIHEECIEDMAEIEDDLMEKPEDFVHELI